MSVAIKRSHWWPGLSPRSWPVRSPAPHVSCQGPAGVASPLLPWAPDGHVEAICASIAKAGSPAVARQVSARVGIRAMRAAARLCRLDDQAIGHQPGACPPRARQEGHPRRFTVIRGATSSALDLCSRRSSDRGRCLCRQGISRPLYSAEVQQRALTTASLDNHQHPELAGMSVKDPAAPLVRDEEAAGSNPATPTSSAA